MNRKSLIIIALLLILILCVVTFLFVKSGTSDKEQPVKLSNNKEVLLEQSENVIKYGDSVYFVDTVEEKMIKYDFKNGTSTVLHDFNGKTPGNYLMIKNSQLLYSYGNVTYTSNLDGTNENKLSNGEIVYIDDNVYITIIHSSAKDGVYVTSYSRDTYTLSTLKTYNVANGKDIRFIKKYNNILYFSSHNSDDTISLLEVDLNTSNASVIDKTSSRGEAPFLVNEYSDVIKYKDKYYLIINSNAITTEQNYYSASTLVSRPDFNVKNVGKRLVKYKDSFLFEYVNPEDKTERYFKSYDSELGTFSWIEVLYGDVTDHFEYLNSVIYMDGHEWMPISDNIQGYAINKVVRLEDELFFSFSNGRKSYWYAFSENNNSLIKIY